MYFPDRGCERTLRALSVYATADQNNIYVFILIFQPQAQSRSL